ncbi:hypothetical protein CLV30_10347 [Haloactinopolyspora alba]|uniref:ATP synthase F0 subunit B n=1 Tax=Haloactinopolyspora alba TaxID=648780 RepID=A0A2P8E8T3_9ACTN|nr:hypothetical protein [Haloactinopolyspora alba]PSL05896.1 hypothetical protein CLV30_10347 [Haloactinopolyspora alba]
MEVHEKITEIVAMVDSARTMPMSSTAMVNKQQLLVLLDEVRECLPENLRAAEAVLGQREALLVEARGNAEKVVGEARDEHARLVDDHSVTQAARIEADEILRVAHDQAQAIRDDADDYVDAKLARLEVAAQRIVETVRDGREQLQHPTPFDELAHRRNGHELDERADAGGADVVVGDGALADDGDAAGASEEVTVAETKHAP